MCGILLSLRKNMNGNLLRKRKRLMSGDTDLQSQLKRLVESVHLLSTRVVEQQEIIDGLFECIKEQTTILAGLADQGHALYDRLEKLESRRIQLYMGEEGNLCIGAGDWQDRLDEFTTPRNFDEVIEHDGAFGPDFEDDTE